MINKRRKMRTLSKLAFIVSTFVFVSVLAFASSVSAGNYRFQNTSGSDMMIINGSTGNVGIGTVGGIK